MSARIAGRLDGGLRRDDSAAMRTVPAESAAISARRAFDRAIRPARSGPSVREAGAVERMQALFDPVECASGQRSLRGGRDAVRAAASNTQPPGDVPSASPTWRMRPVRPAPARAAPARAPARAAARDACRCSTRPHRMRRSRYGRSSASPSLHHDAAGCVARATPTIADAKSQSSVRIVAALRSRLAAASPAPHATSRTRMPAEIPAAASMAR